METTRRLVDGTARGVEGRQGVKLPLWRAVAGAAVLLLLAGFGALLAPLYLKNMQLREYVETATRRVHPSLAADSAVVRQIVQEAHKLGLPVKAHHVQVYRLKGGIRVEVKYPVPVNFALYKVDLHFNSSAGPG